MKRFKHSLSHYKIFSGKMGALIPISHYEVLPGDTIQHTTSALIRFSPLLAPVMHPVRVRIHSWFVPYRLIFTNPSGVSNGTWEEFITGGTDGLGDGASMPELTPAITKGDILDYLGLPPGVSYAGKPVSSLPIRAYNLIFNEFYRDQDLVSERFLDAIGAPAACAWEKDYFTTARPWPQKGPDITLPLGSTAPVVPASASATPSMRSVINPGINADLQTDGTAGNVTLSADPGDPGSLEWAITGMEADLSSATAANVNDLRRAMALQRYAEARAQYGSRYTEYLRYLGVRSSDARLQRPEYLGGGKATIAFSEVLQTGPDTTDDGVADLKGHGISAVRTRRFRRFFEEHGVVMTIMSVLPKTVYQDGIRRDWLRQTREDFFQKELERIGQQTIDGREVYANQVVGTTFGYQDRYAEYRHIPSDVAGDFRDTLDFWHLARQFSSAPTLNASFVQSNPSTRIFADIVGDHLWCMANHSVQARRMVSKKTVGRIV